MSFIFIALSGLCQLVLLSHLGDPSFTTEKIVHIKTLNLDMGARGLMIISIIFMFIAFVLELVELVEKHELKKSHKEKDKKIMSMEAEVKRKEKEKTSEVNLDDLKAKKEGATDDN